MKKVERLVISVVWSYFLVVLLFVPMLAVEEGIKEQNVVEPVAASLSFEDKVVTSDQLVCYSNIEKQKDNDEQLKNDECLEHYEIMHNLAQGLISYSQKPNDFVSILHKEETQIQQEKIKETPINDTNKIVLSDEDRSWLAMGIYSEAGICILDEQIAVGKVILNRAQKYNMSIYDVLMSPGQFSPAIDGNLYIYPHQPEQTLVTLDMVPEKTWKAVEAVLSGEETEIERLLKEEAIRLGLNVEEYAEGGPLYFCNADCISEKNKQVINNLTCKVKLGYQTFYKVYG